jgi:molybdopterin molybdotransferase
MSVSTSATPPEQLAATRLARERRPGGGVPWPDARRRAAAAASQLPARPVPLDEAIGRRLAAPVHAPCDLPPVALSAMDGWAVAGPPPWRVSDPADAGALAAAPRRSWCQPVRTGGPVPPGTAAVLPVERSSRWVSGDGCERVTPLGPAPAEGDHVRPAGEEALAGALLLRAGMIVTPPMAGLAAAAGHDTLAVRPPATVEVLVLGDEIVTHGLPAGGRTRDALGPQLPAWVAAYGARLAAPPRQVPDDLDQLVRAMAVSTADVVVTTGGTSVGPTDHTRAAVARLGGQLLVDGVAVKPGHPMLLAALPSIDGATNPTGRWLVGLPGNPLAACVAAVTLLEPLLDALHGHERPRLSGGLDSGAAPRPGDARRHRLTPVRLAADGQLCEVAGCGAAMMSGLAAATGLAVIGPSGACAGEVVPYLPLPWTTAPDPAAVRRLSGP